MHEQIEDLKIHNKGKVAHKDSIARIPCTKSYASGLIKIYDNFLPDKECVKLINILEKERALVKDWDGTFYTNGFKTSGAWPGVTSNGIDDQVKNTTDFNIKIGGDYVDESVSLDINCLNLYAEYLAAFSKEDDVSTDENIVRQLSFLQNIFFEVWQIQKYNKNEGHYHAYHTDEAPPGLMTYEDPSKMTTDKIKTKREAVIIIYLNDVEEGGETEFKYYDIKIKPKRGRALIFTGDFPFVHKGNMPISSDKYIITSWFQFDATGKIASIYNNSEPEGWPFQPARRPVGHYEGNVDPTLGHAQPVHPPFKPPKENVKHWVVTVPDEDSIKLDDKIGSKGE